jgi:uncharacterized protein
MMEEKYIEIFDYVKGELSCSAHNMDHVIRVYKTCIEIAKTEKNVDMDILIPSALLHDIATVRESEDTSGNIDHSVLGAEMAGEFLKSINYSDEKIEKIKHCIKAHRYRTGNLPETIEAKILFDADKLDAIGAVGVARCLMLSGQHGQRLSSHENISEYEKNNIVENGRIKDLAEHTPIVEYETKLKKIPNKLYTDSAKVMSKSKMDLMNNFFEVLKEEVKVNI